MNPKHLEGLMDKNAPKAKETKAEKTVPFFTLVRKSGGWAFLRADLDPNMQKVVKIQVDEPDMKAVAMERFKIAVGKYWNEAENAG